MQQLTELERIGARRLLDEARAQERFQFWLGLGITVFCLGLGGVLFLVPDTGPGGPVAAALGLGWGLGWWFVLHAQDRRRVCDLELDLDDGRVNTRAVIELGQLVELRELPRAGDLVGRR